MTSKEQAHNSDKAIAKQRSPQPEVQNGETRDQQIHPATIIQRAKIDPRLLSPREILQFQRTIGNQVVSRVLEPVIANTPRERRTLGDLTVSNPMYVTDGDPSQVQGFPKVLGISTPGTGYKCPSVALTSVSGGYSFSKTQATPVPNPSIVIKQGKHELGTSFLMNSDKFIYVVADSSNWEFSPINVTCSQNGNYTVYYEITPTIYQEIVACEQEHLDDFSYAFKISAEAVAHTINSLSGNIYQDRVTAIAALIKLLPIQLVPSNPMALDSWESYLQRVFVQLADLSKERDRNKDHSPQNHTVTCDSTAMEAIIRPIFHHVHRATATIVNLDKITSAYDNHSLVDPNTMQVPPQGTTCKVQRQERTKVYSKTTPPGYFDGSDEDIPPGTECEVVQDEGQGKVVVKVNRQQLEMDADYWIHTPQMTHIYFTISLSNLV